MIAGAHASIVADHEVLFRPYSDFWDVPRLALLNVRLGQQYAVDFDHAADDRDALMWKRNDAFHVQNARAGQPDCHDIASHGSTYPEHHAVDEIQRVVAVRRFHADAMYADRRQQPSKHHEARGRKHRNPDGRASGVAAEKEPSSPRHTGSIRVTTREIRDLPRSSRAFLPGPRSGPSV